MTSLTLAYALARKSATYSGNVTRLGRSHAIAGQPTPGPTGLRGRFDARLSWQPAAELLFGARVIARAPMVPGRPVRTTLRPRLMALATAALGSWLGRVAVIRPRDGAVLALAGRSVCASQPRVHVQIIAPSAALKAGIATPASTCRWRARRRCPGCSCETRPGRRAAGG